MKYLLLCWVVLSAQGHAEHYLIFKSIDDDLGITTLPHAYTVWHVDAIDYAVRQLQHGAKALTLSEADAYIEQAMQQWGNGPLMALILMTYAAREKQWSYGLTTTPSAVLLSDEGVVIERWAHIAHGDQLQRGRP